MFIFEMLGIVVKIQDERLTDFNWIVIQWVPFHDA